MYVIANWHITVCDKKISPLWNSYLLMRWSSYLVYWGNIFLMICQNRRSLNQWIVNKHMIHIFFKLTSASRICRELGHLLYTCIVHLIHLFIIDLSKRYALLQFVRLHYMCWVSKGSYSTAAKKNPILNLYV